MPFYQRKSPRRKEYDYTSPGGYFITICTKDREHYFGEIHDGKMVLNELGEYTTNHWQQIPNHYPFVVVDEFICMPNHVHGILIIGESVGTQFLASGQVISSGTTRGSGNRMDKNPSLQSNNIGPKSGSLGAIIRGFKIGITKYAKQNNIPFARQSRYHDHIIRNEKSYNNIKYYIQTNPEKWEDDMFYA